ncbi:unnamed protein product, partial [Effrenium voratum]
CFDIEAYCPDLRCFRCHGHQCQLIFEVWVRTRQSVRPPDLWPSEARVSLEIVTSLSQALRTFELPPGPSPRSIVMAKRSRAGYCHLIFVTNLSAPLSFDPVKP